MPSSERYEILGTIAAGDFATVFRGVDHELQREIAIKQIHQQYLADPRTLDRYWHEAHLLASLQHPHIMTIYDIVREQGWLILELMQGSMTQLLGGRPIDLKDLRLTMNYSLQALQAMHRHGILHGDIKPSNLLVDRNSRIKLGDFGIARRIAGEGSVTKGTTKYIAPEVVSDQFGEVGPHSDIYSLGFTAFELMCGEHFESLFPGLNMFGRDKQIAWMMWHSAPDRRLPEVARVLDGVPQDLAFIIQKMIEKDPARRYRSTDEVLADLKLEGQVLTSGPTPEELAAAATQARAARRKRSVAIAAAASSIVLSLGMLFFLPGGAPAPPPRKSNTVPASGEVVEVVADFDRLFVKPEKGEVQPVRVRDGQDRVFLNGQQVPLADLDRRDQVRIAESSSGGKKFLIIEATREAAQEANGTVQSVDAGSSTLTIAAGQPPGQDVLFLVKSDPLIEINGKTEGTGARYQLADLRAADRVRVRYKTREDGRLEAAHVRALRTISAQGRIAQVREDKIQLRPEAASQTVHATEELLAVADDCVFSINGKTEENGRPVALADLRVQDRVTLEYDLAVHRIDISRTIEALGVIQARDLTTRTISVNTGEGASETFVVTDETGIEIPGAQVAMTLASLREGDRVTVRRRSSDPEIKDAASISVAPQYEPKLWALLIEASDYGQENVPELPAVSQDAAAIHAALRFQYRVPESQCRRETNPSRASLQAAVGDMVRAVPADAQWIVCFLGRGYLDEKGTAFLAPQDFDPARPAETGISLRWLLDAMEKNGAGEKLLILDTSREPATDKPSDLQAARFAGPVTLAEAARPRPSRPISRSVTMITCCGRNETGRLLPNDSRSVFGTALTAALRGEADANQDRLLDAQELAGAIAAQASRLASAAGGTQTPLLIPADPTPPRLADDAREPVMKLLARLVSGPPDTTRIEYDDAKRLSSSHPDADLAYMLLLAKQDKSPLALEMAEKIMVDHPAAYPAYEVAAWIHGRRANPRRSVALLEQLFQRLPESPDESQQAYEIHLARFSGRLAAFALSEQQLQRGDLSVLEQRLRERRPETHAAFIEGGRGLRQSMNELEEKIAETTEPELKRLLESRRGNFNHHVPFNYQPAHAYLMHQLDQ